MNPSMTCGHTKKQQTNPNTNHNEEFSRTHLPPYSLKVLIVDDDQHRGPDNADIISGLGHAVELALDGIMALRMAAVNRPDAVLLNTNLQCLEGRDVAEQLHWDFPEQRPLIIGFASHVTSLTRWRSVRAGLDLVLESPLDVEAIETLLLFECAKLTAEKNSNSSTGSKRLLFCIPANPIAVVASHSIAAG